MIFKTESYDHNFRLAGMDLVNPEKWLTDTIKESVIIQISSRFIADLKRLADLKRKMDEMDELGRLLKVKLF